MSKRHRTANPKPTSNINAPSLANKVESSSNAIILISDEDLDDFKDAPIFKRKLLRQKVKVEEANTNENNIVESADRKNVESSAVKIGGEQTGVTSSKADLVPKEDGLINLDDSGSQILDELAPSTRRHYTLEIFDEWLNIVQRQENHLLTDEEQDWIAKYLSLSEKAKYLFVRLFLRKFVWLRTKSLENYFPLPNPGHDLDEALAELVNWGFLNDSTRSTLTLEEILDVINLDELRRLCSKEAWAKNIKSKAALAQELIKSTATQPGLSSFPGWGACTSSRRSNYVRRAQEILGRMVRIDDACFLCFEIVQVIYLREILVEGRAMTSAIRVRIGNIRYPTYKVVRSAQVFLDRAQVDKFVHAKGILMNVHLLLQDRADPERFTKAWEECEKWVPEWKEEIEATRSFTGRYFLLRYTAGYVYTKLMEVGTGALARQKLYVQEVDILGQLLAQPNFRRGKRGDWYVRMALIQHTHLPNRKKGAADALATCLQGIRDPYLSPSCLNDLIARIDRLKSSKSNVSSRVKNQPIPDLTRYRLRELPEVVLEGERTRASYIEAGTRLIYRAHDGAEITVESLALDYYQRRGYMGYHCEGSLIATLFGLIFWDLLFSDHPGVFETPYQSAPLDLSSDAFYIDRNDAIQELLERISNGGAADILATTHQREFEKQPAAVGVNWSYPLVELLDLCRCIGGPPLASILKEMAKRYRDRRSGFPDLTLWHPEKGIARFAEVKGPNDHLSQKQRIWLNDLLKAGLEAELCTIKLVDETALLDQANL